MHRLVLLMLVTAWAGSLGPGCSLTDPEGPVIMVRGPCKGGNMTLTIPKTGRVVAGLEPLDCVRVERIEDGEGASAFCPSNGKTSSPARFSLEGEQTGCARVFP